MKTSLKSIACTALLLTLVPSAALAQDAESPPPSSPMVAPSKGTGLIVAGAVFTGLGVANLATSPICLTLQSSVKGVCLGASLAVGGIFTLIGVPMLAVGASKRAKYLEWKQEHPWVTGFGFDAGPKHGALSWQTAF